MGAVFLLGAFFRLYRLDSVPPGLWIDEINVTHRAAGALLEKPFLPFGGSPLTWLGNWVQTSNLYLYSIILIFKLFGYGFWQIKMVSLIPGLLGVPALYLFVRELAGKAQRSGRGPVCRRPLERAPQPLGLGRSGDDDAADRLFLLSCTRLSAARAAKLCVGRNRHGLCLNTYIASRLALAAALACLGLHVVSRWGQWRERVNPLGVFASRRCSQWHPWPFSICRIRSSSTYVPPR